MDDIKKPEEQVSAAPAELTQAELDKVAGGADKTKDEETIRNAATVLTAMVNAK